MQSYVAEKYIYMYHNTVEAPGDRLINSFNVWIYPVKQNAFFHNSTIPTSHKL